VHASAPCSWELSRSASKESGGCSVSPSITQPLPKGGLSVQIVTWKFVEVFLNFEQFIHEQEAAGLNEY